MYKFKILFAIILVVVGCIIAIVYLPFEVPTSEPTMETTLKIPTTIRVLRTQTNVVEVVDFKYYVQNGVPNEWHLDWDDEALKVGAMAYKTHGIYRTLHPLSPDYDTLDSSMDQIYEPGSAQPRTNQAIEETWDWVVVRNNSIFKCPYHLGTEGTPENIYNGSNITEDGIPLEGRLMQWGSQYWAERGKNWQWILHYYYDPVDIVNIGPVYQTFHALRDIKGIFVAVILNDTGTS